MEGFDKLGLNGPYLIAQIVGFLLLLGILYAVAYKPVLKMLDTRSQKIKESMQQTDNIKLQAEKAQEEFKKKVEEASLQGRDIIERATKTGEEIKARAKEDAKVEADALVEKARSEIRRERDEIVDELRKEYADLTMLAASKVIDKTLDRKAHIELIEKALEESDGLKKG